MVFCVFSQNMIHKHNEFFSRNSSHISMQDEEILAEEDFMESMGRIMEIRSETTQRVHTGIKGGRGYGRTTLGYFNGYGSFMEYPETHLYLIAYIYETKESSYIDIRDYVLTASGRKRITAKYLDVIKRKNEGKKVSFENGIDGVWRLKDFGNLDI